MLGREEGEESLAYGDVTPVGVKKRGSVRLPVNRIAVCVLFAMFVIAVNSMAFGCWKVQEPLDEPDPSVPASSLAVSDVTFAASPNPAYVGEEVTFWANASSTTGSLTFTIYFDAYRYPYDGTLNPDSGVSVNVTGSPGNVVQKFTYNTLGNFTVEDETYVVAALYIDDGISNLPYSILPVYLRLNGPPEFITAPTDDGTLAYVPLNLSIEVMDDDNDPIDILWEFGDGTEASNTTDGTREDRYVNQTHTWRPYVEPGTGGYSIEYKMNVTIADSFDNSVMLNATITVTVPDNGIPKIALASSSKKIQPEEVLVLWANATDPEGDPLTWTFNYSDGTTDVVHTDWTEPGTLVWCNMTHIYDEVGNYTITMHVSDALGENQVFPHNVSTGVGVTVAINRAPFATSVITVSPESPEIDAMIGFVDVCLSIQANDLDGDILTASWYINDAVDPVVNISAGGTCVYEFIQVMTITEPGSYNVSVVVTDGHEGHEITITRIINATSNNLPPVLLAFEFAYASGEHAIPLEEIEFLIVISDPEQDPIQVTFEFGDDSPRQHFNLSDYVNGNITLMIAHVYEDIGVYQAILRFTDNKIGILNHSKVVPSALITVKEVYIAEVTEWDWWDYTSLSIVFAVPITIGIWMHVLKRKTLRLERQGMTLEEARMKDEAMLTERLLRGGEGDG